MKAFYLLEFPHGSRKGAKKEDKTFDLWYN